jgi:hypothetical protein
MVVDGFDSRVQSKNGDILSYFQSIAVLMWKLKLESCETIGFR